MLHFNLSSSSVIWQWEKRFKEHEIAGLERRRGNPKTMAKHKTRNLINSDRVKASLSSSHQTSTQSSQGYKKYVLLRTSTSAA
ncbi:hypothetical protein [Lactobacillus sp. CBA3606]|uniref:hypothetical protein n=1 Tax=Lactobacillus sp. CBA3606 TaxID=2099789 RepID=UPI00351A6736